MKSKIFLMITILAGSISGFGQSADSLSKSAEVSQKIHDSLMANQFYFDSSKFKGNGTISQPFTIKDTIPVYNGVHPFAKVWVNSGINKMQFRSNSLVFTLKNDDGSSESYDTDAQAYFTAAGITNTTFMNAWNDFVLAAKGHSYYSKIPHLNPLPGTSSQNTFDAITATAITSFFGSPTHATNGVTFNGVNQYANAGFKPSDVPQNKLGFFAYSATAFTTDPGILMGTVNGLNTNNNYILNYGGNFYLANNSASEYTTAPTERTGIICGFRDGTPAYLTIGNTYVKSVTGPTLSPLGTNFYICADNNVGTADNFNAGRIGAFGLFNGLTTTDHAYFITDFSAFLTATGKL